MSIRARLLWIALLATLLPALLVLARFFVDRQAAIRSDTELLAAAALHLARDIVEKIQGTAQPHFGLARARDLATDDRAACSAFLSVVREAYPVRNAQAELQFVLLASLNLEKLLAPNGLVVPGGRILLVDHKGTILAQKPTCHAPSGRRSTLTPEIRRRSWCPGAAAPDRPRPTAHCP